MTAEPTPSPGALHRPSSLDGAVAADGVLRAGGTDLQERLRRMVAPPAIVDLTGIPALAGVTRHDDGSVTLGALVTVADVAGELARTHPAVARTAAGLATPQIRAVATLGGNLTQRTRCWYFRHPHLSCLKSGGSACPARDGDHLLGVVFDLGACVHPHPSSLGMALLASDAEVSVTGRDRMPVAALWGDGSDPRRDHQLEEHEVLSHVHLPAAWDGERAAYVRAISRFEAEWPLVEAVARIVVTDGVVARAAVAVGGVATVPLRLSAVEAALRDGPPTADVLATAADRALDGVAPLPGTGYKVALLRATVLEVLERATRD